MHDNETTFGSRWPWDGQTIIHSTTVGKQVLRTNILDNVSLDATS